MRAAAAVVGGGGGGGRGYQITGDDIFESMISDLSMERFSQDDIDPTDGQSKLLAMTSSFWVTFKVRDRNCSW